MDFLIKYGNLVIALACLCRLSKSKLIVSVSTLIIFIDHLLVRDFIAA